MSHHQKIVVPSASAVAATSPALARPNSESAASPPTQRADAAGALGNRSLASLFADRRARIDAAFAHPLPTHPPFAHKPPLKGHQWMIYGGPLDPLEFVTPIQSGRVAWARANDAALNSSRTHVCVRDTLGRVVFNGPKLDARGRPVCSGEPEPFDVPASSCATISPVIGAAA